MLAALRFFGPLGLSNGALRDFDLCLIRDLKDEGTFFYTNDGPVDAGSGDYLVVVSESSDHRLQLLLLSAHGQKDENIEDNSDDDDGSEVD